MVTYLLDEFYLFIQEVVLQEVTEIIFFKKFASLNAKILPGEIFPVIQLFLVSSYQLIAVSIKIDWRGPGCYGSVGWSAIL